MATNTLSFRNHNSPTISLELVLGEGDSSLEAALEILACLFTVRNTTGFHVMNKCV